MECGLLTACPAAPAVAAADSPLPSSSAKPRSGTLLGPAAADAWAAVDSSLTSWMLMHPSPRVSQTLRCAGGGRAGRMSQQGHARLAAERRGGCCPAAALWQPSSSPGSRPAAEMMAAVAGDGPAAPGGGGQVLPFSHLQKLLSHVLTLLLG